jgi:sugar lactone lactonase YvrE
MVKILTIMLMFASVSLRAQRLAQFSEIKLIAGTAKEVTKGSNSWKKSFERKSALKAELNRPHFAMADTNGNVFIADKESHSILVIREDGDIETVAGTHEQGFTKSGRATSCMLSNPNGLFVFPNGEFFILDLGNSRIRKVDENGKMTTLFRDPDRISFGRGLWVSAKEDTVIYSSGTELRIWTKKNGLRTYADGFKELGNICMDVRGNLVVTDRGDSKVYRLNNTTGKPEHIAGTGGGSDDKSKALGKSLDGVRAVWADPDGGLWLGCHEGDDLYYMDTQGNIEKVINGSGDFDDLEPNYTGELNSDTKYLSEIRSVCVDNKGNVIICHHDGGLIHVLVKK